MKISGNSVVAIRKFDAFSKPFEELSVRTFSGALLTIGSLLLIVFLAASEFRLYLRTQVKQQLYVDVTRGQKVNVMIDVTFHRIACKFLSVHAMDISGEHQTDVNHQIYKVRLNRDGESITAITSSHDEIAGNKSKEECGSCYGAETKKMACCNSCADVELAYRNRGWVLVHDQVTVCRQEGLIKNFSNEEVASEGCRIHGFMIVNKVAGNLHISPGKAINSDSVHVHDIRDFKRVQFNTSLTFNRLAFGKEYPGIIDPLSGTSFYSNASDVNMFSFYTKVVPTTYISLNGSVVKTNQFSVTKHRVAVKESSGGIPGLLIVYEFSPIMVHIQEHRKSFMHFITSLCAIIGGVYTVSSLADAFLYHSVRAVRRKIELGKLT